MAVVKEMYRCKACGFETTKWSGKCPGCGTWNQMEQAAAKAVTQSLGRPGAASTQSRLPRPLKDVQMDLSLRYKTGIGELDRVLGGGIVPDSISILAARPGAGKSTLLLQAAHNLAASGLSVLYVSGEESESQIRRRAERILSAVHENIWVLSTSSMNEVLGSVAQLMPNVLIVDSIQTMAIAEVQSRPGSPTQTMECTSALLAIAKDHARPCAVFLTGQLTKDDELAGVRALEHMVDTVLFMDSDEEELRLLSATKNRFGSTGEMGFFLMEEKGLMPIENPSEFFMTKRTDSVTGSALTVMKEGTRPIICEVEALVSQSFTPYPSRISECMHRDQMNTLISILEQRGKMPLYDKNVVIKATGGIKLTQQAANLAILCAIASSATGVCLPSEAVLIGDVGLTGELKRVPLMESRLKEAERMGFSVAYVPQGSKLPKLSKLEVRPYRLIYPLLKDLFHSWQQG